jgi:hypothetical protein
MSTADQIDSLVSTMTLEVKLGQMTKTTAGMTETGPAAGEDLVARGSVTWETVMAGEQRGRFMSGQSARGIP